MKHLKFLQGAAMEEAELARINIPVLNAYLEKTILNLEYRIRYATVEETTRIQGALRALDDIKDLLP
jgi:hypothetical protein